MKNKKSIIKVALASCLIVPSMFMLSACGGSKTHHHTFSSDWTRDATNHWHMATCDHTDKISDESAHTYSAWSEKTPAGLDVDKVEKRNCLVCDYEETRTVADSALHNYDASVWQSDDNYHWHITTCEHTPALEILKSEHVGTWAVKTEAGYGVNRVEERTCTVCGKYQTKTIENSALAPKTRTITIGSISDETFNNATKDVLTDEVVTYSDGCTEGTAKKLYRNKIANGEWTEELPLDAGTYETYIQISGTAEWAEVESNHVEFTINPYVIELDSYSYEKDYDGRTIDFTCNLPFSYNNNTSVRVEVPAVYSKAGRSTFKASEMLINARVDKNIVVADKNFNLILWDKGDFYMSIQDIIKMADGERIALQGVIARGTLNANDTIEVVNNGKTIVASEISLTSRPRVTIDKVTTGDSVYITINSGITREELNRGYLIAKTDSIESYDVVKASMTRFTRENSGNNYSSPIINGEYFIQFDNYYEKVSVRLNVPDGTIICGNTEQNVEITFGSKYPLWANQKFKVYTTDKLLLIGEGTINTSAENKDLHSHTEEYQQTGKCSVCGRDSVIALNDSNLKNYYIENESKFFSYSINNMSGNKYKLTLNGETNSTTFSVKVYDYNGNKETYTEVTLKDGVFDVGDADLIIVITRVGNLTNCTLKIEEVEE